MQDDFGFDQLSPLRRVRRVWRQFKRYAHDERRLVRTHPGCGQLFGGSREIGFARC